MIGSWTRGRLTGLVLGIVVSSVLFTLVHGATDPYLVVWYLALFGGLAVITWRTGGLEIAIMLHAVLNTLSLAAAPYLRIDLGAALQGRSETVGSAYQLVPALTVVVITAVVWWATRRSGPARTVPPHRPERLPVPVARP